MPVIGSVVQRPASGLSGAPVVDGLVFRLTYRDVTTNSGEVCGSITSSHGWFLKGYVGLGAISSGSLQDEDFPPAIVPYSSTTSQQHGGYLDYASIDVGYNLYRGGDFDVGAFVGYHIFNEVVDAYGCAQTAGNPDVCHPSITNRTEVISENNTWQSVRVGLNGSVSFSGRFNSVPTPPGFPMCICTELTRIFSA